MEASLATGQEKDVRERGLLRGLVSQHVGHERIHCTYLEGTAHLSAQHVREVVCFFFGSGVGVLDAGTWSAVWLPWSHSRGRLRCMGSALRVLLCAAFLSMEARAVTACRCSSGTLMVNHRSLLAVGT